jgi:general secretion pathway protein N
MVPAGEPASPAAPNPFFSLTLEALEATRSAPLFTPSRTAPATEPPPEPEPIPVATEPVETEPTPPTLQLVGIVVAGQEEVAILSDAASGEVIRLHPGEEHQGWKLKILDGQSVELSNGEESQKLSMFTEFPDAPRSANARSRRRRSQHGGSEFLGFGGRARI